MTDLELTTAITSIIDRASEAGFNLATMNNSHFGPLIIPSENKNYGIPCGFYTEENVPTGSFFGGFPTFRRMNLSDVLQITERDHAMLAEISRRSLAVQKTADPEAFLYSQLGGATACACWFNSTSAAEKKTILCGKKARSDDGMKLIREAFISAKK